MIEHSDKINKLENETLVGCPNLYYYMDGGEIIKNYKTLCGILKEPVLTSNSKRAQLKNWQRYFDFEKIGVGYLIKDIYETPLPKEDGRLCGNNSIYVKYIKILLLKYLSTQPCNQSVITKNNLYYEMSMVNKNYLDYRDTGGREKLLGDVNGVSKYDVREFYRRVPTRLDRILFSALNSLSSQFLIEYEEEQVVIEIDECKNGFTTHWHRVIYDAGEKSYLLEVKNRVLKIMGLNSVTQVYYRFKTEEFYNKINQIILNEKGWYGTYKRYKITTVGKGFLEDAIEREQVEWARDNLNSKMVEVLNTQSRIIYDNNTTKYNSENERIKKDEFIGTVPFHVLKERNKVFKMHPGYVSNQDKLVNYLIKID